MSANGVTESQIVLVSAHAGRLVLSVAVTSLLGRMLAPADFGFVALVSSLYIVAVEVLDMGTTAVATRKIAAQPAHERGTLTALFALRRLLSTVLLVVVLGLAFSNYVVQDDQRMVLVAAACGLFLLHLYAYQLVFQVRQAYGQAVALGLTGQLGFLLASAAALRETGSRVLYFAGYKKLFDRYKVVEIEAAADEVVWCCDEAPGFKPTRAGDKTYVGNIVEAIAAHASGILGTPAVRMQDADRVIAIGSDGMMGAVARACHALLAPYLRKTHVAVGSINSPMRCMMKEICAQCLQPHVDPATGKTTYVFSCFNQDQPLDHVDFPALRARLGQNSLQEKVTARWIDRVLERP